MSQSQGSCDYRFYSIRKLKNICMFLFAGVEKQNKDGGQLAGSASFSGPAFKKKYIKKIFK